MRKMFLVFAIISVASMIGFAQKDGKIITSKVTVWSDSLQYQTDAVAGKDSVKIIRTNYNVNAFRIYLDGNDNSPVDSLKIQLGGRIYDDNGVCVDTSWGSIISLKDSVWALNSTLINQSTGKDFSSYTMPPIDLIKITLLNYRAAVPTRKVTVTLQGTKD